MSDERFREQMRISEAILNKAKILQAGEETSHFGWLENIRSAQKLVFYDEIRACNSFEALRDLTAEIHAGYYEDDYTNPI